MSAPIVHVDHGLPSGNTAVGWDIDVDLAALQPVLLIEPTIVLWGSVPVANLHKGIPQQQRDDVMVQAPRA
jgi:hypothetical protein